MLISVPALLLVLDVFGLDEANAGLKTVSDPWRSSWPDTGDD